MNELTQPEFTQVEPPKLITKKRVLVVLGVICTVLLFGALGTWYYITVFTKTAPDPSNGYEVAVSNLGGTLEEAVQYMDSGNGGAVRMLLMDRAAASTNALERGVLLLTLAQFTMSEDIAAGVRDYKAIGADELFPPEIRATAFLGLALHHYMGTIDQDALTRAIFTGEAPYAEMSPEDGSAGARETAYAALVAHADTLHATPVANGYLAKYWAKQSFGLSADEAAEEEAVQNADAHIARTKWLLEETTSVSYDLNFPMSKVQLGLAHLYLKGSKGEEYAETGMMYVSQGLSDFFAAADALLAQYRGQVPAEETMRQSVDEAAHALFRDMLTVAVDVKAVQPELSTELADLYAAHITSDEGAYERGIAERADADIAPLIAELTPVSTALSEALQTR